MRHNGGHLENWSSLTVKCMKMSQKSLMACHECHHQSRQGRKYLKTKEKTKHAEVCPATSCKATPIQVKYQDVRCRSCLTFGQYFRRLPYTQSVLTLCWIINVEASSYPASALQSMVIPYHVMWHPLPLTLDWVSSTPVTHGSVCDYLPSLFSRPCR